MKKVFLLLATLLVAVAAFAGDQVVEEIIARVNNAIITRSEFQHSREQTMNELKQLGPEAEERYRTEGADKNILRDLIDQQLLLQKGADLGYTGETEVVKELDRKRKEMGLDSMEALENDVQKSGYSFEEYKQQLRDQAVIQKVIGSEVAQRIQVTNEQVQAWYEQNKQKLYEPEESVRLSEILISPVPKEEAGSNRGATATPEQMAAAQAKAQQVLQELRGGARFEDLAIKDSQGETAAQGGDLGVFKRGSLSKELEQLVFSMKRGDISDVVQTKQGFIILKVTDLHPAGIPPLAEVRDMIRNQVTEDQVQPALRQYLTKLREEAYIQVKANYVDTGADPNQTAQIVTGPVSSDSSPRKTKRKKKFGIL